MQTGSIVVTRPLDVPAPQLRAAALRLRSSNDAFRAIPAGDAGRVDLDVRFLPVEPGAAVTALSSRGVLHAHPNRRIGEVAVEITPSADGSSLLTLRPSWPPRSWGGRRRTRRYLAVAGPAADAVRDAFVAAAPPESTARTDDPAATGDEGLGAHATG